MRKNNKGFTLIELLAVIVILSIILTIATTSVIKNINDSKDKAKYIAAKEIVQIAEAYLATETEGIKLYEGSKCVTVSLLMKEYLENDVTNPRTGENSWNNADKESIVCYVPSGLDSKTTDYKPLQGAESKIKNSWAYYFDNYFYRFWTTDDSDKECIEGYEYVIDSGSCVAK